MARTWPAHAQQTADALAARGAEMFDRLDPQWFMKMPDWDEDGVSWFMGSFDITSECSCVVGRYYGEWGEGSIDLAQHLDPDNAHLYEPARGWDSEAEHASRDVENLLAPYGLTIIESAITRDYDWSHLNQAWETEIEKRLANA